MVLCKLVASYYVILMMAAWSSADIANGNTNSLSDDTIAKIMTSSNSLEVGSGCQCANFSCGCCGHVEEDRLSLNATVCVNLTYLSRDIGISLTATVNNHTFLNKTVSVRNPPAICVETPYIHVGSLCVVIHDIDAHRTSLHACVAVEAMLKHVTFTHVELGCFTLGDRQQLKANIPKVNFIK